MSIDLLDTPLRLSWDLHRQGATLATPDLRRVAEEVAAAGVFYVTLDGRPLRHPAIRGVIETLAAAGCMLQVAAEGSDVELRGLAGDLPITSLLFEIDGLLSDGDDPFEALAKRLAALRQSGYEPTLLLPPLHRNVHLLPALLDFCRREGVKKLKLPNVKAIGLSAEELARQIMRPDDLEALRQRLGDDAPRWRGEIELEIHDLFLWEIFYADGQEGRSEYGGCQAANSLAHVDAAGQLFPCSSWPERLGSLLESSVEALWQSETRLRLRRRIEKTPDGCLGCRDVALCFGGCRGLAGMLSGPEGRDPLCRGRR